MGLPASLNTIAALTLALTSVAASAATITVTTTADNTNAEDGECSMREAITNANAGTDTSGGDCTPGVAGNDDIIFDPSLTGATITLNGTELPAVVEPLTISGPEAENPGGLTVDANASSGILTALTDLDLSAMTLTGGVSADVGGAVAHISSESMLTLSGVDVAGNRTTGFGANGGGVHATSAMIIDSIVSGNSTEGPDARGGGIYIANGNIVNSLVTGNTTTGERAAGGGLYVFGSATIENSTISNNTTHGNIASGGGVKTFFRPVSFVGTTIAGNRVNGASADGGGASLLESVDMVNCTISGNSANGSASRGAAIELIGDSLSLVHSTIAGNTIDASRSSLHLDDPSEVEVVNSIVVTASGSVCSGPVNLSGSNLFTDTSCGGPATPRAEIGLAALADNGGPTLTHAPRPGSVAINAAGECRALLGVTTDQRGEARPWGPACDIGAVESQGQFARSIPALTWPGLVLFAAAMGWLGWRRRNPVVS